MISIVIGKLLFEFVSQSNSLILVLHCEIHSDTDCQTAFKGGFDILNDFVVCAATGFKLSGLVVVLGFSVQCYGYTGYFDGFKQRYEFVQVISVSGDVISFVGSLFENVLNYILGKWKQRLSAEKLYILYISLV